MQEEIHTLGRNAPNTGDMGMTDKGDYPTKEMVEHLNTILDRRLAFDRELHKEFKPPLIYIIDELLQNKKTKVIRGQLTHDQWEVFVRFKEEIIILMNPEDKEEKKSND